MLTVNKSEQKPAQTETFVESRSREKGKGGLPLWVTYIETKSGLNKRKEIIKRWTIYPDQQTSFAADN